MFRVGTAWARDSEPSMLDVASGVGSAYRVHQPPCAKPQLHLVVMNDTKDLGRSNAHQCKFRVLPTSQWPKHGRRGSRPHCKQPAERWHPLPEAVNATLAAVWDSGFRVKHVAKDSSFGAMFMFRSMLQ